MSIGERMGAAAAAVLRSGERALHRLARPAALALAPVLIPQARRLREGLVQLPEPAGTREGAVGAGEAPLRLLAVGDSTATGVGTTSLEQTLPVQTARRIAEQSGRPVAWRIEGLAGIIAREVLDWHVVDVEGEWDVIMVQAGANDAMRLVSRRGFDRAVRDIVARLERHLAPGGVITLAGAPQIDTFAWLPQPTRGILAAHARSLDRVLVEVARASAHVVHVPTPAIADPELHASDGFHPSALGYEAWSRIIAPRVLEALERDGCRGAGRGRSPAAGTSSSAAACCAEARSAASRTSTM